MKIKASISIIFVLLMGVLAYHSRREQIIAGWNPSISLLDGISDSNTNFVGLMHDVCSFYDDLHKKQWESTYNRRWKTFRYDFPMALYLKMAAEKGNRWSLLNYEILSIETYNSDEAVLICKFIESPGAATSYSLVRWRKEDGTWRCDAAGPIKLSLFRYTRARY
jgi:hypothetical protein